MQRVYPIYCFEDDRRVNLSNLSTRARRETETYKKRKEVDLYCECCRKKMHMTSSGKIFDSKDDIRKHKEDCARRKVIGRAYRLPYGYDPLSSNIEMNYEREFGNQIRKIRHLSMEGYYRAYYYKLPIYVKWCCTYVYNERVAARKFYGIDAFSADYYKHLTALKIFNTKDDSDISNFIEFHCGKLVSLQKDTDSIEIAFKTYYKLLTSKVSKKEFSKVKANYKSLFKKDLDANDHLLYVEMRNKEDNKKKIHIFPVTRNGLVCDSFLEQRVYTIIEQYVKDNSEIVFEKLGRSEIYEYSKTNEIWDDDGIIKLANDNGKRVVIEIFGMMSDEDYKEEANRKITFVRSMADYYMLDIYPEDKEKTIICKLEEAKKWLMR